jgi:hypothetical protein
MAVCLVGSAEIRINWQYREGVPPVLNQTLKPVFTFPLGLYVWISSPAGSEMWFYAGQKAHRFKPIVEESSQPAD